MRRADIARLLPGVYRMALEPPKEWDLEPDPALGAVLDAMEQMHDPIERVLDDVETLVDPRRTRPNLVPYLCGWLDLEWLLPHDSAGQVFTDTELMGSDSGQLREVAAAAAEMSRWRGTNQGLLRFLETATSVSGFKIVEGEDEKGQPIPFHITVHLPPAARSQRPLVERVVVEEKPAYVTHQLHPKE